MAKRTSSQTAKPTAASPRLALCLLLVSFAVYLTNLRPMGEIDTLPARMLTLSLAREADFDLDEFPWLSRDGDLAVLLRAGDGRLFSRYPVATPLLLSPLALPAVAWLRLHDLDDDDVALRVVALVVERIGAALIAAISVAVLYLTACTLAPPRIALAAALVYAFGTATWSISSQAMWQHGLAELSLVALSYFLLAPATPLRAGAAGAAAAIGVAARPTMLIFALLATLHMWRRMRRHLMPFLLAALPFALALLAYNFSLGGAVGGYARALNRFAAPRAVAFVGLLASPNRGLFIYTPIALLAPLAFFLYREQLGAWQRLLLAGSAAYLVLYSCFLVWWGGNVYGARFLTDILPALALAALPAAAALARSRVGRIALTSVALWGVAVQVIGVYFDDGQWNITPYTITYRPERVWDWRDPQILRAASARWHGGDYAPLLWQTFAHPRPAPLRRLSDADLEGEVTIEDTAAAHAPAGGELTLRLRVVNRGSATWPVFSDYGYMQVALLSRWWHGQQMLEDAGQVVPLPRNLGAGESTHLDAHLAAPLRPGAYQLEILAVQQLDLTQGVFGGAAARLPVRVD